MNISPGRKIFSSLIYLRNLNQRQRTSSGVLKQRNPPSKERMGKKRRLPGMKRDSQR
jgi:hypothetical protein